MKNAIVAILLLLIITALQAKTDTLVVFFDIGESFVDNNNTKQLDKLIADKNVISISIYGYTDFLGNVAYNQQLSEKRSANVRDYLIQKGIDEKNIVLSKGEGIFPNSNKENRQDFSDKGIKNHRIAKIVYTTQSQNISAKEKLTEENLVAGNTIVLENILFHQAFDTFLPESYPVLETLLAMMQKYLTMQIEIQGHICCTNIETQSLSTDRAKAVFDYLVKNGIKSFRMTYKGFGATQKRFPLEQNEDEKAMNRRVEILIIEK